jgi:DNA/RNA endonuclease G (NUC1)
LRKIDIKSSGYCCRPTEAKKSLNSPFVYFNYRPFLKNINENIWKYLEIFEYKEGWMIEE